MLNEHKRIVPKLRKAGMAEEANEQGRELISIKKKLLKKSVKKHTGKGGMIPTPFSQASTPIDLLKSSMPPTVRSIPRSDPNSLGKYQ